MRDAINLSIDCGGIELPTEFVPYWKMISDHIDNLRGDDSKKGNRNTNTKRKRSDSDNYSDTHIKESTEETITFPNGNVLRVNDSISKDVVNFVSKEKTKR